MIEKPVYSFEAHTPKKIKGISYAVCENCGLVFLRNPFTQWSIRLGCLSDFHPEYSRARKLGPPK